MAIKVTPILGIMRFPLVGLAILAGIAACQTVEPIQTSEKIGLVLLHGKNSGPTRSIEPLAFSLERAGVLVDAELMPWGRGRIYDKEYEDSMGEIDEAVQRLKTRGAKRIVVAGHSLGANVALGYGARREGLAGIILLAMGHPLSPSTTRITGASLAQARTMIAEGNADKVATFQDFNQGRRPTRRLSAKLYLSWFDPNGPASTSKNAANLKQGTPVLWVSGDRDRITERGKTMIFDKLPPHPLNRYEVISSTHRDTPADAAPVVVNWLRLLK